MAQARNAFALSLLLTAAGGLALPSAARAEPPLPLASSRQTPRQPGLISQLRVAMGLSAEPGQPMRLIPPGLAGDDAPARSVTRGPATPLAISPPTATPSPLTVEPMRALPGDPLSAVSAGPADRAPGARAPAGSAPVAVLPPLRPMPPLALGAPRLPAPATEPAPVSSSAAETRRAARPRARPAAPSEADDGAATRKLQLEASVVEAAPVPRRNPMREAAVLATLFNAPLTTGDVRAGGAATSEARTALPSNVPTFAKAKEPGVVETAAASGRVVADELDPLVGPGVLAPRAQAHGPDGGEPTYAIATYSGEGDDAQKTAQTNDPVEDDPDLPPPAPSELPRLMRVMSALQDDIARGASSALKAQRVLSQRVAQTIAQDSDRTLAVSANARALLHYALTGGSPVTVRKAVSRTHFRAPYDALMAGALAFLEGRQNDARRHFADVDLKEIGSVVEGPVRLALAALSVEEDPRKALLHLDYARHSAPGSLVEEAALRRAVLIAAETNDIARFENHTDRYLRKFSASAYAGNFRRRLVSALTRMAFLDDPDGFERLERILAPMPPDGKREVYLDLARAAVEGGRSAVAARAARLGREIAPSDSLDAQRAELYQAAADVVDPGLNDAAVATLGTLDVARLPKDDQMLRTAALRLGQAVGTLPEPPLPPDSLIAPDLVDAEAIANLPPLGVQPTADALVEDEPSDVEQRVATTLAEIDAILRTTP